jgi:ubiquinol-cytochrome c reductase cytochrome b subunit
MKLLDAIKEQNYPVPAHSMRLSYMFGGIAAFLLVPLAVTGVLLAYYGYVPSAEQAHKTAADATVFGSLAGIRAVHSLTAELFLALIFLHATRIVVTRSYHGERKIIWYTGVVLLFVAAFFFLTGTTLKLDQAGYETYAHLTLFTSVNQVWFRGAHVILLPILIVVILGVHALLIKEKKISPLAPGRRSDDEPDSTFFHHMQHVVAYGFIATSVAFLLAAFYTPPLLGAPVEGVEWTKPPWPFLFLYPLNSWALISIPLAAFAGLVALPFLTKPEKRFDLSQAIYFVVVALWFGLSLYGAFKHYA